MGNLETQFSELMAGQKLGERQRNEAYAQEIQGSFNAIPGDFEKWSVCQWQSTGRPYVKFSCPTCKSIWTTGQLEMEVRHCGDVSRMPEEISKKLEALQIKLGIRIQTFVDGLLGKSRPAPTPNLDAF